MARKKKNQSLSDVKQFSQHLLYEATSGKLGLAYEISKTLTFGEKRGLLDSLIKIAALEKKDEGDEDDSGFDKIRRELDRRTRINARGDSASSGNTEGPSDDGESEDSDAESSEG